MPAVNVRGSARALRRRSRPCPRISWLSASLRAPSRFPPSTDLSSCSPVWPPCRREDRILRCLLLLQPVQTTIHCRRSVGKLIDLSLHLIPIDCGRWLHPRHRLRIDLIRLTDDSLAGNGSVLRRIRDSVRRRSRKRSRLRRMSVCGLETAATGAVVGCMVAGTASGTAALGTVALGQPREAGSRQESWLSFPFFRFPLPCFRLAVTRQVDSTGHQHGQHDQCPERHIQAP